MTPNRKGGPFGGETELPRLPEFNKAERDDFSYSIPTSSGVRGQSPRAAGEALDAPSPLSLVFPRNDTPVVSNVQTSMDTPAFSTNAGEEANAILSRYFDARTTANRLIQSPRSDDRRRSSPSAGSDRWPSTINGSAAQLQVSNLINRGSWLPVFSSVYALPCVDRHVRRGVMFAKKKAGKGYRRRKRRNPYSGVQC